MSAYECFLESTYNILSSAIMKDGSSNIYLMARLPVHVSAYFRIWLCCMGPKSLTTNGPTHRGHTCRSLDATFSPNALCMQLLLYVCGRFPSPSQINLCATKYNHGRHLNNPNLEGREGLLGWAREGQCASCFCRFIFGHYYSSRCTQLAKKIIKHYEIFG